MKISIIVLITTFFFSFLYKQDYCIDNPKSQKTVASVGIYIIHLGDIDVKSQTFYAEFYFNMKWKGQRTAKNFEFINAKEFNTYFYEEWVEKDTNWLTCKVRGTFRTYMDVSDYPIDHHKLPIIIGDYIWIEDSLSYQVNNEITGISGELESNEWDIAKPIAKVKTVNEFEVNYSTLEYSITVSRKPESFIIKILIPIVIVIGVSLLNLFIPKEELEACVALGITSLLSIIALHFAISRQLPDVNYATKIDLMMIGSYSLIFLSLIEVVLTYHFFKTGREKISIILDKNSRWVIPLIYVMFLIFLFFEFHLWGIYNNYWKFFH